MPLDAIVRAVPPAFILRMEPAAVIRFGAVAGRPFASAEGVGATPARVFWLDTPDAAPTTAIPFSLLIAGLKTAWPQVSDVQEAPTSNRDFYAVAESLG